MPRFNAEQILPHVGLSLPSYAPGSYRHTCPQCSHTRKKRTDECVEIEIRPDGSVVYNCHHATCGWHGPTTDQLVGLNGARPPRNPNAGMFFEYPNLRKYKNPPGSDYPYYWRHLDGSEWKPKRGPYDIKGLLYRIDAAKSAIALGQPVLVVEGEKDVDTCARLGFYAVSNADGATKWRPAHSKQLQGAHLVVLNDNDKVGYEHAELACKLSLGVAASVRRLDIKSMWPEVPEHGDVSDWIAKGHTAAELRDLIDRAPPYQPPPPHTGGNGAGPPQPGQPIITEQSVMLDFVAEHKGRLRYNHSSREWLTWHEHYWKRDEKQIAFAWSLALCRRMPRDRTIQKVRFARAVEEASRAQPEFATANEDWDRDPWLLGTPDGVVNLKTGHIRPGAPTDMVSKVVRFAPSREEDCPRWIKFVNYALNGKDENIEYLKRCCGYALTGLTSEERLLFIIGLAGTGKGTLTKTFVSLLGDYAANVPISMFTAQSDTKMEYYRAGLAGYRLILASEPEKGSQWSEAFINEVTGSDRLSGRHPGGRPFHFDPTHKIWLQGNTAPDLKGVATGLRRRLDMLPFDQVPSEPDPHLKEKLTEEGPGILRWAINGCLDWQTVGLEPPPEVATASAEYFEVQDTFKRWLDDCCDILSTAQETPAQLRSSFNQWATKNNEKLLSANAFHDAIKFFQHPAVRSVTVQGKRWVKGLALRSQQPENQEFRY